MKLEPIGVIQSCFKEKFAIPRQAGLAPGTPALLKLKPGFRESLRGIEEFGYIWIVFVFHDSVGEGWKPLVRPPRLGGKRKIGVLATRSPHRPNPIGLSAVRLVGVNRDAPGGPELRLAGGDFLDGTPVLDIKPYVPYSDSIPRARAGWAQEKPRKIRVSFTPEAARSCAALQKKRPGLRKLLREILALDPRPAFQAGRAAAGDCSSRILDLDVHWTISAGEARVSELTLLS